MTLRLRRKRQTTVLLVWMAIAAVNTATATAQEDAAAEARASRQARRRAVFESATAPARFAQPPAAPQEAKGGADLTRIKVDTEPPSPQRLFQLRSTASLISEKEKEIKTLDPSQSFLIPGPSDRFNNPDSVADNSQLGGLWVENSIVELGLILKDVGGLFGIKNNLGMYPFVAKFPAKPAAAVLNEYLSNSDHEVSLDIQLSSPTNEFGVVFRAKNAILSAPEGAKKDDVITFYNAGEYYAAVANAEHVEVFRSANGKRTKIQSATMSPKTVFRLMVRAVGQNIRVYRDGQEVLACTDSAFTGHYAGVIGLRAEGTAVKFDNFEARSYPGEFMARAFAASNRLYRGPNVHFNPLYFEQRPLERYGHHLGNFAQPFIAHGLFFANLAMFPISVGRAPWWECHSGDLFARPGDVVPFHYNLPEPPEAKGTFLQLGLITALALSVP